MATASGNFYGEYSKQSRLRLYWEYTQDTAKNCDYFYLALYAQKPDGIGSHNSNYNNSTYWLTGLSNDALINETGNYSWANNTELFIGESWFTNYHNDNGTSGDVSVSGSWFTNLTSSSVVGTNLSVSGVVTNIPTIPRYTTLYAQEGSKGVDYFYINWSTKDVVDALQYSLNGGSWVNASMNSTQGGYFYVSASPNTTYSVKCRARRKDSQLWTTKGPISVTTYDIARLTSYPNFNLGDSVTIKYTNPSGTDIEVGLYDIYGEELASYRKVTGNSYTFNFTNEELDKIYKAMEKNNSLNVCFYINTNQNKYRDYKTVVVTLTGNQKTGHINVSNVWKRSKKWINVNGTWKRCVRWLNVDGSWKRCI